MYRTVVKIKYEVKKTRIKRTGASDTRTFIRQIKICTFYRIYFSTPGRI